MSMEQRYHPDDETTEATAIPENLLHKQERIDAEEALKSVSEETDTTTPALTVLLQQEGQQRSKETWAAMAWSAIFLTSMFWLLHNLDAGADNLLRELLLCLLVMGANGGGLCFYLVRRAQQRKRALETALDKTTTKQHVASLIRTLRVQNTDGRNLAKQRLISLLPTLQASDTSLLGDTERKILLRQLAIFPNDSGYRDLKELFSRSAFRREMDVRLAILKALEQVGGEQELGAVERLARGLPTLHSQVKVLKEIRDAAAACLPYLQTRAADQRAGAQLLRASSLPTSSGDDLLRPAAAGSMTPPEQLLRAGEAQP